MTAPTEEFELAGAPAPAPMAAAPTRRRRLRGRPATWVTVALVLILAGAVAAPSTPPVRPDLGAGVRWNVTDVDLRTEPEPMWKVTLDAPQPIGVVEQTLLVSDGMQATPEDEVTFTAVDVRTGEIGWTLPDTTDRCQLGSAGLVCVTRPGQDDATIRTIGPDGGETSPIPYPGAISAVDLGDGGFVVVQRGSTQLAELVRIDAAQQEVWRTRLSFSTDADASYTTLTILGDVVSTTEGRYALATGELPDDDVLGRVETAPDGTIREWLSDGSTRVVQPDGTEVLVPPNETWLPFDEAFGGPVAIQESVEGTVITPIDRPDAAWTLTESEDCWLHGRVQGVLLQLCFDGNGSENIALDQVTGETLWTRSEAGGWLSVASTDALLLSTEGGVIALDPRTGEQRWSIAVPGMWSNTAMFGDALLVWSDTVLIRLR